MSTNAALLQQAKQTDVNVDHSTPTKGGPRIPVEGKCPARLVGYIELGKHPQPDYKGQAKQPETEVQLVFECFGKDNMDEIEIDGKKKTVGRMIRPLPMTLKVNERAKFYKTFQSMDYGRGLDHMSKMLNDVFRLTISHGQSKSGNTYAKIDAIESPLIERVDPETGDVVGTTDITEKVPPATHDLQLFIVDHPTYEQWESIYIDGTYTKKTKNEETGEEVKEELSKNFIQEKIQAALDWEGSAMQTLLLNLDEDEGAEEAQAEEEGAETPAEEEAEEKKPAPKKTAAKTAAKSTKKAGKKAPAKTATKSPSEDEDTDALLDELGL